ncbi:UDP-glucose dehydrogenase family protein [Guptibacillus algicola]|uniref:UDP-glucose dehydrogenase family protein n=1 Tax=Guptibacillus algicola TaxID=225844 RepID=UPI001CD7092F|nr:UDP-glucose/GDP-mannose dehydrogenase family protein [Alkalihalobacillus algicola]MCA0986885.1 UDP-glucose/GDP-mannose dehydrogenase family protein [Alkalihalobacillus algicola]
MNIAVIGTGYVGLVTGVSLAEIGHNVICIDKDDEKVRVMSQGKSPIYEPKLEELMKKNIDENRLVFTTSHHTGIEHADVIYIAVGTPQLSDGTADLSFIDQAAFDIARSLTHSAIVVTKSTVPVGTNERIQKIIHSPSSSEFDVHIVSNPEFLREGSAVYDTFNGDRIVIGADHPEAGDIVESINLPFGIPIYRTDIKSAEMIKYASNAFLATKISFINDISNICEKVGANIEDVAAGMGKDHRIGNEFLNAGIGYGGSCFPKDTKALVQIAGNNRHDFKLLKSVIEVNNIQQMKLVQKAKEVMGDLKHKKIALLGLAFKPNTNDMREAASIPIAHTLIDEGADIYAYDPVAMDHARSFLPEEVVFCNTIEDAISNADAAFIITEWGEIKALDLAIYERFMSVPLVFDGRNCYSLEEVSEYDLTYLSIGRPMISPSLRPTTNQ